MPRQVISARRIAVGILATGGIGALIAEYPGTFVYDSLIQLLEGRTGNYTFWHPPVMSWLLGLSDRLAGGAAVYVSVQILLGFGALAALICLPARVSRAAAAVAAAVCALPQLLMFQGYVLKDVLFADATLAAFVALGLAARFWPNRGMRWGGLGASAALLILAALTRQNGVLLMPFAVLAVVGIAARQADCRGGIPAAVVLAVVVLGGMWGVNHVFAQWDDGDEAVAGQFKTLRTYDLAGMIVRRPDLPLPILDREAPLLAAAIRSEAPRFYTPRYNDLLSGDPVVSSGIDDAEADVLSRQWRQAIAAAPGPWLAHRAAVFAWLAGPTHVDQCHPFYAGVHGAPEHLRALGWKERMDARDWTLFSYGSALQTTPVFWHWLYGAIVLAALGFCLYRRRPEDLAVAGLCAGVLAFAASFFVISIACDYRYLYALDLSAIAALLYWAADPTLEHFRVLRKTLKCSNAHGRK